MAEPVCKRAQQKQAEIYLKKKKKLQVNLNLEPAEKQKDISPTWCHKLQSCSHMLLSNLPTYYLVHISYYLLHTNNIFGGFAKYTKKLL